MAQQKERNISGTNPPTTFPEKPEIADTLFSSRSTSLAEIDPHCIHPNPFQARTSFDDVALQELSDSIRLYGVLVRVRVRPHPTIDGHYQLIYGERRLRASKIASLPTVPCEVAVYTDDELKEIGLIENIQRKDLLPLEEAHTFRLLLDQTDTPYSIRTLAARIGKNKSYIEDRLALLKLPQDVLHILEQYPRLPLRALIEIAKIPTAEARKSVLQQLQTGAISTRDCQNIVAQVLDQLKKKRQPAAHEDSDWPERLLFQRTLNKTARRLHSACTHLQNTTALYHSSPDPTKKALLLEQVRTISNELKHIEDSLL